MKYVFGIAADVHAGSAVALCPPQIALDDNGTYYASPAQLWLWADWIAFWKRVKIVRDREKAKLIQVYNGDLVEGSHHGTTQILSGNPTAQAAVLDACMKVPLALKPDYIHIVRGTESHVGQSASSEERVARGLHADGWPVVRDPDAPNNFSSWHVNMEVNGVRLSFAHHGRQGQRPHTRPNVVNLLAFQIWCEAGLRGDPFPHLAVRSHMHQYHDTANAYPTRVIQTASFQLRTSYVHRVATESLADVGGTIVVIDDAGGVRVEPVLFRPDAPTTWRPAV